MSSHFDEGKVRRAGDGKFAEKAHELAADDVVGDDDYLQCSVDNAVLVYENGSRQPLEDITWCGTLMDDEGDDLQIVGVESPHGRSDDAVLVWCDDDGNLYEQPLGDLVDVGGLIDPDTGDDLSLASLRVSAPEKQSSRHSALPLVGSHGATKLVGDRVSPMSYGDEFQTSYTWADGDGFVTCQRTFGVEAFDELNEPIDPEDDRDTAPASYARVVYTDWLRHDRADNPDEAYDRLRDDDHVVSHYEDDLRDAEYKNWLAASEDSDSGLFPENWK